MRRKTAIARAIEINGVLVIADRTKKIAAVKKWFEKSETTAIETLRLLALTDTFKGDPVSELVEGADFTLDDLPMII
jgi:hypothetical protein